MADLNWICPPALATTLPHPTSDPNAINFPELKLIVKESNFMFVFTSISDINNIITLISKCMPCRNQTITRHLSGNRVKEELNSLIFNLLDHGHVSLQLHFPTCCLC